MRSISICMASLNTGCLSSSVEKSDIKKIELFPRGSPVLFSKVGVGTFNGLEYGPVGLSLALWVCGPVLSPVGL
jgi:hypothetical protein